MAFSVDVDKKWDDGDNNVVDDRGGSVVSSEVDVMAELYSAHASLTSLSNARCIFSAHVSCVVVLSSCTSSCPILSLIAARSSCS